jgi:PAS domain S-box-containing protein
MPKPASRILIVESNPELVESANQSLEREGLASAHVPSIAQALSWLDQHRADLILLHLAPEDLNSSELTHQLAEFRRRLPFVVVTLPGDDLIALEVLGRGSTDHLGKEPQFARFVPEMARRALGRGARDSRLAAAEEALRASEERYRMLFDYNPMPIWVFDTQTLVFLAVNEAVARTYGYSREELLRMTIKDIRPAEDVPKLLGFLAHRPPVEQVHAGLWRHRRKDGSLIDVEIITHSLAFDGRAARLVLANEVTERNRAETALKQSEANLAKAQQIAHLGSYEISLTPGGANHWSAETFRILGRDPTKSELSGADYVGEIVHPDDRTRVRQVQEELVRTAKPFEVEYRVVRPDGTVRHVQSIGEPVLDDQGQAVRLIGTVLDITERKELEREILEISEREQRRIGQDLHDGLGQHLAGLELMSQVLEQNLAGKNKKEAMRAREIARHVRGAISQTRSLARGLSPVLLESEGLMSALADLATSTEQMFHLSCRFHCDPPVLVHDHAVATHLYRIAQEAVSNAIKHGKATTITIGLRQFPERIELGIHDDGVGLAGEPVKGKGMGLRIMRYRADMIGGSLGVVRRPEGGTAVTCSLRNSQNLTTGQLA